MSSPDSAREAYARLAAVYDECTAQNDYEMWLGDVLLPELEKHGLRKGWALDVGCGTGRAFGPLLDRSWRVIGCDLSPEMLAEAKRKFGRRVDLFEADARRLPPPGALPGAPGEGFELILLLNDVLNYMVAEDDLEATLARVRTNLNDHGLVLFDLNTLALFRRNYGAGVVDAMAAEGWEWQGLVAEPRPGMVYEARVSGKGAQAHLHRQRHWPRQHVLKALEDSALSCVAMLGQREEDGIVRLSDPPDEERDQKIVYIARRAP